MEKKRVIVIGGGAAGFFAAVNAAALLPAHEFAILEQSPAVLSKVKISGGGRCNLTHACFEPRELTGYYPRGNKALMGPFTRFMTGDVMGWFEYRGLALKIEDDGRIFPQSDQSQSVIDCLTAEARQHNVQVKTRQQVQDFQFQDGQWSVLTREETYRADALIVATGSSKAIWKKLAEMGHHIIDPVPSLFTFNIKDPRIEGLQGLAVASAGLSITGAKLQAEGPLLITHWGMSGPAILKLSAWGARKLFDLDYKFSLEVNWLPGKKRAAVEAELNQYRQDQAKKQIHSRPQFGLPQRLWRALAAVSGVNEEQRWAELSNKQAAALVGELTGGSYEVDGKSTFKEEFVTAGGVDLKEVNFKTMESKHFPSLYFAGEVLDIDAVTGGFNFQAAWTTAWIAAQDIAENLG